MPLEFYHDGLISANQIRIARIPSEEQVSCLRVSDTVHRELLTHSTQSGLHFNWISIDKLSATVYCRRNHALQHHRIMQDRIVVQTQGQRRCTCMSVCEGKYKCLCDSSFFFSSFSFLDQPQKMYFIYKIVYCFIFIFQFYLLTYIYSI